MYKYFIVLLAINFLSGCAGNPTVVRGVEIANNNLYEDRSPFRADVKVLEGGGAVVSKVWAGEKGVSVMESAEETLKNDVWKLFEEKCGFHESDLIDVRVVEHKHPFYYEVWVFNDAQSIRDDGKSGIALILSVPSTGGTDIELVGDCRA